MITEDVVVCGVTQTEAACKNCGTALKGHFCASCGQPDKDLDPPLHDLLHELVHEFVHLDGKILATLKALVLSPGRLSAEFLAGRRARYISPVRLYLTLSLLFFLLAAYSPQRVVMQPQKPDKTAGLELQLGRGDAKDSRIEKVVSKAVSEPEVFKHAFLSNVSRVMFAIVPLFALGLYIAYRNRSRRYPAFVYFSLHYHSFIFAALTFYYLVTLTRVSVLESIAGYAVAAGLPAYLFLALRIVFGGSKVKTALRMMALTAFYLPCLVIGVGVAGVITLFTL